MFAEFFLSNGDLTAQSIFLISYFFLKRTEPTYLLQRAPKFMFPILNALDVGLHRSDFFRCLKFSRNREQIKRKRLVKVNAY